MIQGTFHRSNRRLALFRQLLGIQRDNLLSLTNRNPIMKKQSLLHRLITLFSRSIWLVSAIAFFAGPPVDAQTVFYQSSGNSLLRMGADGSSPTNVSTGFLMDGVTVAGGFVYYETNTSGFTIARQPVGGGSSTAVFSNAAENGIFVSGRLAVNSSNGDIYYAGSNSIIKRWEASSGLVTTVYTPDGSIVSTITDFTIDATNGHIYFTGNGNSADYVRRIAMNGSGDTLLASFSVAANPRAVELDLINSRFYVLRENNAQTSQLVDRFNLDGSGQINLVTGATYYSGIAVDPTGGSLFLAGVSDGKIYRGGLDASGLTAIYTGGTSNALLAVSPSAIPEPSTYAAIFGAAALGLAVWRRRVALRVARVTQGAA